MNTDSLFLALNFEGTEVPKRVELVPAGAVVTGRDGRSWKNTNPKLTALNSMARLPKLPIDENHATDLAAPSGGASPALGWITALNAGENGAISGDVEWTPKGKKAVLNKEYAYISPVFLYDKNNEINCILRAGLTNAPNLGLPALNGERYNENFLQEKYMDKALCDALRLPESAGVQDALAAVEKLKTARNAEGGAGGAGVDLQTYAPRVELNAALEKAVAAEKRLAELNAAAFKKDAEAAVDAAIAAGKFPPAARDSCIALCADKTGLERFNELAAKSPAVIDGKVQAPETPPPAGSGGTALNSEDAAVAKAMGYSIEEYQKIKEAGK